jgi:hypothetical protein
VQPSRRPSRAISLAVFVVVLCASGVGTTSAAVRDTIGRVGSNGASASAVADRIAPPTSPIPTPSIPSNPTAHFATLAVGSALPSDASCAAAVRPAAEIRPDNVPANHTIGSGSTTDNPRVTGNFTGTTDEIIQWVACKWGIDEDVVRAQIAKESAWHQSAKGDQNNDQSTCYPALRTSSGSCPESIGLGQVRYLYHGVAFANGNAVSSSAYNLDYTYAQWRACFNGDDGWLNSVSGNGGTYAAGDMWGCVGLWFAGRWSTDPAKTYVGAVQDYLRQRVWATTGFVNW